VSARLAAAIALGAAGAALAVVACRQVLGVQDLGVAEGGSGACNALSTTEACYSCCAEMDGGDLAFFQGDLHACACNTECSADCPAFCSSPQAPPDITDCDICVYLSEFSLLGSCRDAGIAASQSSPGSKAIYDCISTCPAPSDQECAGLSTLRGCYDCCEGKHLPAADSLFSNGRSCVCDGGCAGACPDYCTNNAATDVGACTRCALGSLIDGGCASTGASLCTNQDCLQMVACMQLCAQAQ
jgi:hypothetical protein